LKGAAPRCNVATVGGIFGPASDAREGRWAVVVMEPKRIFHPWLDDIAPYVPGRPPGRLTGALSLREVSRLASNENPLGPSPRALEAYMEASHELNRYPDDTAGELKEALAARFGVGADHVVVGNGSNDLIDQCVRVVAGPGQEVVMAQGSFPTCRISTQAMGARLRLVPLRDDRHDLEAMAEAVTDATRLVYVCNPNNPTGTMNTHGEVEEFLKRVPDHVLVVFDEAYYEYVERDDFPRLLPFVRDGYPVVLLRTFSKVHALASLRVGYGLCPPAVAERLQKVRLPFNVNGVAQKTALAAMDDADHVRRCLAFARQGKAELESRLRALGLRTVPSQTNFLMVEIPIPSATLHPKLLESGVQIRPLASFQLPDDHYRITVGTREEDARLLQALERVLAR
jgi:histidinol-phosphate aminotransferase